MPFQSSFLEVDSAETLLVVSVFFLAGLVKGVVGLGLPTVSMALLALMFSPTKAAALLVVPSLVTNVWQLRPLTTLSPLLRRLAPMQAGICAGTSAGAAWLGAPAGAAAVASLGAALVIYASLGLCGVGFEASTRAERWLGPTTGALTGLVTAATGVFVVPAVPYLQALRLSRDELIQAMGLCFTVSTVVLAVGLYAADAFSGETFWLSLAMLLPSLTGMQAGQWLRRHLAPDLFRRVFLSGLLLLGGYMVANELLA